MPSYRDRNWQPYQEGRWVYTEQWGWYWVSNAEESDWGWVAYHYGRWIKDRDLGWAWVPGDEWAPAWVKWRRGPLYVGWAPLAPDDVAQLADVAVPRAIGDDVGAYLVCQFHRERIARDQDDAGKVPRAARRIQHIHQHDFRQPLALRRRQKR